MNIAILGLGTIGSGVYELLKDNKDFTVKKILDIRCWMDNMTTDIENIVNDETISLVVETMGGLHPAREYALKCIAAGKSYISANKLLISECASELQAAADENNVALLFSAACGGGIPFLYNLNKTKMTDRILEVGGILNGTSNYILDRIFTDGETYDSALKQAQELGYAERDPSSDVEGLDTLRKLVLSCAVAYGKLIDQYSIPCHGISMIDALDIQYALQREGVIKLMACGENAQDGKTNAYVMPKLANQSDVAASIRRNVNYAYYRGERIGEFGFTGQGAGKFPTANNIIRDLYVACSGEKRMFPDRLNLDKAENSLEKTFYIRVQNPTDELLGLAANIVEKNEWKQITTRKISFDALERALKGLGKYFVMIVED